MRVVLLGAPGAGKGTQAAAIRDRLGVPHVATGDLFRSAVRDGTTLGGQAAAYMNRGDLVPDDLTIRMLLERLDQPDAAAGAILDGFPRTALQAEALDAALAERGQAVDVALLIDVPVAALVERLSGRRICEAAGHVYHVVNQPPRVEGVCDADGSPLVQRDDDRPATIEARLHAQLSAFGEVVEHYRAGGRLRSVDGDRPAGEVSAALVAELDRIGA